MQICNHNLIAVGRCWRCWPSSKLHMAAPWLQLVHAISPPPPPLPYRQAGRMALQRPRNNTQPCSYHATHSPYQQAQPRPTSRHSPRLGVLAPQAAPKSLVTAARDRVITPPAKLAAISPGLKVVPSTVTSADDTYHLSQFFPTSTVIRCNVTPYVNGNITM